MFIVFLIMDARLHIVGKFSYLIQRESLKEILLHILKKLNLSVLEKNIPETS